MVVRNRFAWAIIASLGALNPSTAAAEVTMDAAYEMMIASGAVERILNNTDELDTRLGSLTDSATEKLPEDISQRLPGMFRSFVDTDHMITLSVWGLSTYFSEKEVDEFKAFYRTPLGRRIAEIEVVASGVGILDRISDEYDRLDRDWIAIQSAKTSWSGWTKHCACRRAKRRWLRV
jgi:hypothetical protein